jgi:hypothetical protein
MRTSSKDILATTSRGKPSTPVPMAGILITLATPFSASIKHFLRISRRIFKRKQITRILGS